MGSPGKMSAELLSLSIIMQRASHVGSDAFPVFGYGNCRVPSVIADDDTETNPVSLENVARRRREKFAACEEEK